jgi:predicted phosphodiesterase
MTDRLFQKAAIFADIHFGKSNNDRKHNLDCLEFVRWFCQVTKERKADCVIFLGDFYDNRQSIHLTTLNYSMAALDELDSLELPIYFILGNHDLLLKDRRDVSSVVIAKKYKNIKLFSDIETIGKVTFCPWLIGEEWRQIPDLAAKSTYMFGHFELPLFLMNQNVEKPDEGGLQIEHFDAVAEFALSGHFHKRQTKGKVIYMGNTFPHNFADVWDTERGMAMLDWGAPLDYVSWPKAPVYKTLMLSELLDDHENILNEHVAAKITSDLDITFDQGRLIRDVLNAHCSPRKLEIITSKFGDDLKFDEEPEFKTVDQIVVEGLIDIDSVHLDKRILIELYRGL